VLARSKYKGVPVACIILAAGLSARFGSEKMLVRFGPSGKSLIQNAVDAANGSKSSYVLVVLGHKSNEIMENLNPGRAQIVLNKAFRGGLSSSIRTGISNVPSDSKGAILMVADQPFLTKGLLNRLIDTFKRKKEKAKIVCLSFRGEPRNPALFGREYFPKLSTISGDVGAKQVIAQQLRNVTLINVEDERVFLDIDTRSTLRRASGEFKRHREKN
jgi:molybdenum cofactor cytidylyltransferase